MSADPFVVDAVKAIRGLPPEQQADAKVRVGLAVYRAVLRDRPDIAANQESVEEAIAVIVEVMNDEAIRQHREETGFTQALEKHKRILEKLMLARRIARVEGDEAKAADLDMWVQMVLDCEIC